MIATTVFYSAGCRCCTCTCDHCPNYSGGTYAGDAWATTVTWLFNDRQLPLEIKDFEDIPYKQRLWAWLRKLFPFIFPDLDKLSGKRISRKRYSRRMLFCKSGYLPVRIRKKKMGA